MSLGAILWRKSAYTDREDCAYLTLWKMDWARRLHCDCHSLATQTKDSECHTCERKQYTDKVNNEKSVWMRTGRAMSAIRSHLCATTLRCLRATQFSLRSFYSIAFLCVVEYSLLSSLWLLLLFRPLLLFIFEKVFFRQAFAWLKTNWNPLSNGYQVQMTFLHYSIDAINALFFPRMWHSDLTRFVHFNQHQNWLMLVHSIALIDRKTRCHCVCALHSDENKTTWWTRFAVMAAPFSVWENLSNILRLCNIIYEK